MSEKQRLDSTLFARGLAESREKAKAYIMSGIVFVNNQKADKPGMPVKDTDQIEVRGTGLKYVSRGGLKLEKAVNAFALNLSDKICADIGASTGGFTDCMLQNGAAKVYAIDVGYGQLDWKLRTDSRVVNLERTNFRYVTAEQVPDLLDFASVDVSFISLTKILPVLHTLLKEGAEAVCLIKPQFEAGREKVGKKGVVRDPVVHKEVIESLLSFAPAVGFSVLHLSFSPIRGPEGNIEYLLHIRKDTANQIAETVDVQQTVKNSHEI